MNDQHKAKIEALLQKNKIVLFMKGTSDFPQCGFSMKTAEILKELKAPFQSVNVLEDRSFFEALKEYSNWPTSPQLYINKKFVGGCDIVMELYQRGELQKLVNE